MVSLIVSNGLVIFLLEGGAWKPTQVGFNELLKCSIEHWLIILKKKINLFSGKTEKEEQQHFNALFCLFTNEKEGVKEQVYGRCSWVC